MIRKIFLLIIVIGLIFPCYGIENYIELFKAEENQTYYFNGYYFHNDKFIVSLFNNGSKKEIYYQFKNNKLSEIENKQLENYNITREYYDSSKKLRKSIFPNNDIIKKYCVGGVKYSDQEYVVCLEKDYMKQELNIFDGKKFTKIETGDIHVKVGYGETYMFYDKQYDNLYFSGYKTNFKYDEYGLYVFNFKTKNTKQLQVVEEISMLIAPYRIPGTDKLIYLKNTFIYEGEGIKRIYLRDIEK